MNKRGKIWGSTECLFNKNNAEIHRIEVKKGGFCSLHKHEHKHNLFYVEHGRLQVIIYRTDAGKQIEDRTILEQGDMTFVQPGELHLFEALEDTIAFEIYYAELNPNDIIRENCGGIK